MDITDVMDILDEADFLKILPIKPIEYYNIFNVLYDKDLVHIHMGPKYLNSIKRALVLTILRENNEYKIILDYHKKREKTIFQFFSGPKNNVDNQENESSSLLGNGEIPNKVIHDMRRKFNNYFKENNYVNIVDNVMNKKNNQGYLLVYCKKDYNTYN